MSHVAYPTHLPSLVHLDNQELQALYEYTQRNSREVRRDASKGISKVRSLGALYIKTLGKDTDSEVRQEFERELVKHPDCFLTWAYANSLTIMAANIRDEMLRRSRPQESKHA